MAIKLGSLVIHIIINAIVLSPTLWLAGKALVDKEKAKFFDAVWIIVLGTVVGTFLGAYFTGIIASILQLLIWLALVKHFFDCGWLKALVISVVAVILFALIAVILGLIGFALFTFL